VHGRSTPNVSPTEILQLRRQIAFFVQQQKGLSLMSDSTHQNSNSPRTPMRVALLGYGTVGATVARLLTEPTFSGIELTHIFNRNVARKQAAANSIASSVVWTESIDQILGSDVDVIVELTGGVDPTEHWVRAALEKGKHVVTANKQLIALRGTDLLALAAEHDRQLLYGAAVAGGVPVIPGILQGISADRITAISGIVNGTCNFILSKMENGASYADVLAEAQGLGYAEADPSADVDGYDARAKLCILARIAMHVQLDPNTVPTQTISTIDAIDFTYAHDLNCTIRQIAQARLTAADDAETKTVQARVAPMLVPRSSPLAFSRGTQNTVVTTGQFGGDVVFSGRGAGGEPTAIAVLSDLLAVAQNAHQTAMPVHAATVDGDLAAPHYLRFVVDDRPGIVFAIAGALAAAGANIDSLLQRPGYPKHRLPFVITTESSPTSVIERAIATVSRMDFTLEPPLCLPMIAAEP
jgi:homoserine dehydrogenase